MTEDILSRHPFLLDLPSTCLSAVARIARQRHFPAGTRLLQHDVEIVEFYLLEEGRVALEIDSPQCGDIFVQTLGPGAILGWSWLIPPYRSHFDATALEDVDAIAVDAAGMRAAMEHDHDLGYAFLIRLMPTLLGRLQACRMQVMDVYGQPGCPTP